MVKLRCFVCGVELDANDDFEAGMWAAWHMHDFHADHSRRAFSIVFIDPEPGRPPSWCLELAKQVVQ